jgi:hypothetical protein
MGAYIALGILATIALFGAASLKILKKIKDESDAA